MTKPITRGEIGLLILLWSLLVAILVASQFGDRPRLIGYGCEGASGPIYAQEEDHFPPCGRIERN